jgi:hypothetical protein
VSEPFNRITIGHCFRLIKEVIPVQSGASISISNDINYWFFLFFRVRYQDKPLLLHFVFAEHKFLHHQNHAISFVHVNQYPNLATFFQSPLPNFNTRTNTSRITCFRMWIFWSQKVIFIIYLKKFLLLK